MEKVIFISPHLDDAIFSCAGLIQKFVSNAVEVEIITVFSSAGNAEEKNYRLRKLEDKKAADILGAQVSYLDFVDAPYRYQNADLIFRNIEEERPLIQKLSDKFIEIASLNKLAQFIAPLGVGWHIDHMIVFQATLSSIDYDRLLFYAESPYRDVLYQTEFRIKGVTPLNIRPFAENFLNANYVKEYLPHWNQSFLLNILKTYKFIKCSVDICEVNEIVLTEEELKKSHVAKMQYNSQQVFYTQENQTMGEKYFKT